MLFGASRLSRGAGSVTGITFVNYYLNRAVTSFAYPSGTQAGDIAIMFEETHRGTNGSPETPPPTQTIPPGYSYLLNQVFDTNPAVDNCRVLISYKILTATDVSNGVSNLTGSNEAQWMLVFRPNVPTSSLITSTPTCEITAGNPTSQTIACANAATPMIAIAWFQTREGTVNPRTSSVTMTELEDSITINPYRSYLKYKIYNMADTAQSITVDMDDETTTTDAKNILTSFYLKVL